MRHVKGLAACAAAVVAMTVGGIARATAIAVPDGGFELDTNTGWQQWTQPNSGDWTVNVTGGTLWGLGIYNSSANPFQGNPSEGSQFLSIYPGQDNNPSAGPYATATVSGIAFPVTETAGYQYVATVDIALCPGSSLLQAGYPNSVTISLMEGSTTLASGTGAVAGSGVWVTVPTAAYTAADSNVHNLSIQIVATNFYGAGGGNWDATNLNIDNVTLTETPAPEPATLSLLGVSAVGLLARRRRA